MPEVYWICTGSCGFGVAAAGRVLAGEQRGVIRQQDAVADGGKLVAHGVGDLAHRIAAELAT